MSGRRRESNPGPSYLRARVLSECLSVGRGLERRGSRRTDSPKAHLNLGGLAARMFIQPSRPSPLGTPTVLCIFKPLWWGPGSGPSGGSLLGSLAADLHSVQEAWQDREQPSSSLMTYSAGSFPGGWGGLPSLLVAHRSLCPFLCSLPVPATSL